MAIKVGILALEGCVALSVYGPADLFSTANTIIQQLGRKTEQYETRIISLCEDNVTSASGHAIVGETRPLDRSEFDVLVLPGIGAENTQTLDVALNAHEGIQGKLVDFVQSRGTIAAACTGTFILARAGLLDGRRATTTWWMADHFRSEFPFVELAEDDFLVDEGQVITSAAGASSLDLALHIIERYSGASIARLCAKYLVVDGGRKSQRLYAVPKHSKTRDPMIEKADRWIRARKGIDISVDELAGHLGVGTRTMLRKFRAISGVTPQAYIQRVRLDLAKPLLEDSDASVAQIAARVGFSDENAFRKAFARRTGLSPTQYRKQFKWN